MQRTSRLTQRLSRQGSRVRQFKRRRHGKEQRRDHQRHHRSDHTAEPFVTLDRGRTTQSLPIGRPRAVAQPRYDLIFFKQARCKDTV